MSIRLVTIAVETLEMEKVSWVSKRIRDVEIKEKIIQTAGDLFMKYGIRSVTMDDIAKELSISKKTIYQYYKDKDEIVSLVTQAHMTRDKVEFDEIMRISSNAVEELAKICICLRRNLNDINPSLLFDLQRYHQRAWTMWFDYKYNYIKKTIVDNITRGIREGYFRKEIDPETMATFRVEQIEMSFDDKIFPRDKFSFMEVQMQLFDHFVHGIVTEKGRHSYENYLLQNTQQN
ncbi:TetR/AcrR family transcriptional regulator [Fulvivirgaceae bacterium BMA10]|uniref:TetR/AcrR family transcriptional regulator n=1 Tax=Splendidivirga corallicola TaxID=3051826 RepID=A0ABT8KQZ1_9BACT|nr:TetR/AcrR family transcriptional regulator [Fulvivirgaceae bacterium BMA10]